MLLRGEELDEHLIINPYDPYDIVFWTKKLQVTEAELANAVAKVGNSSKLVTEFLSAT